MDPNLIFPNPHQYVGAPNNAMIPNYQQLWQEFQNIHYQRQMWQMYYMKLYYDYLRFCSVRNLNYQNITSYNMYFQYKFGVKMFPENQMSQNGQNNDINNTIYIKEKLNPLLPRPDSIENNDNKPNMPVDQFVTNPDLMSMTFVTNTGHRMVLVLPKNTTILQMCNMYMDKMGLPRYYIGNDIQFLYNAKMIDPFSNETIFNKFQVNVSITVFDQGNVIGAALN